MGMKNLMQMMVMTNGVERACIQGKKESLLILGIKLNRVRIQLRLRKEGKRDV